MNKILFATGEKELRESFSGLEKTTYDFKFGFGSSHMWVSQKVTEEDDLFGKRIIFVQF